MTVFVGSLGLLLAACGREAEADGWWVPQVPVYDTPN